MHLVVQDVREDGSALFNGSSITGLTVIATRYHLGGEGLSFASIGFQSCTLKPLPEWILLMRN